MNSSNQTLAPTKPDSFAIWYAASSAVSKSVASLAATNVAYQWASSVPCAQAAAPKTEVDRQIDRLKGMIDAKAGWAGAGSCAPDKNSIALAVDMLRRLRSWPGPAPMASVSSDGNAGLSWSDGKMYADIEIFRDGKIGYLIELDGKSIDNEEDFPPVGLPGPLMHMLAAAYLVNR